MIVFGSTIKCSANVKQNRFKLSMRRHWQQQILSDALSLNHDTKMSRYAQGSLCCCVVVNNESQNEYSSPNPHQIERKLYLDSWSSFLQHIITLGKKVTPRTSCTGEPVVVHTVLSERYDGHVEQDEGSRMTSSDTLHKAHTL
jgi:hypothetical protein